MISASLAIRSRSTFERFFVSPLKLLAPRFVSGTELELAVGTADGSPLDAVRVGKITLRASGALGPAPGSWPAVTNPLVLGADGVARATVTLAGDEARQFYSAVEQP